MNRRSDESIWSEATLAACDLLRQADSFDGSVEFDAPLGSLTTYRVGGPSAVLVVANSTRDLECVADVVAETKCSTLAIGRGSNLLVADRGFDGIAVKLSDDAFASIEFLDGDRLVAGGSAMLPVVARQSAKQGLTGFEWAVGVPGSIGGAVRMNAGGHGSDMAATLCRVSVFHLERGGPESRSAKDLDLGYRHSNLQADELVLFAELHLAAGDAAESESTITDIVRWRREHQPGGQNAGSVFANPPGLSAGRLIDGAGLKGFRIGTAAVSIKHANFIQADPDGSADDVHSLIRHIQQQIVESDGVLLQPENRLIGFDRDLL